MAFDGCFHTLGGFLIISVDTGGLEKVEMGGGSALAPPCANVQFARDNLLFLQKEVHRGAFEVPSSAFGDVVSA